MKYSGDNNSFYIVYNGTKQCTLKGATKYILFTIHVYFLIMHTSLRWMCSAFLSRKNKYHLGFHSIACKSVTQLLMMLVVTSTISATIVGRGDWLGKPANFKGVGYCLVFFEITWAWPCTASFKMALIVLNRIEKCSALMLCHCSLLISLRRETVPFGATCAQCTYWRWVDETGLLASSLHQGGV